MGRARSFMDSTPRRQTSVGMSFRLIKTPLTVKTYVIKYLYVLFLENNTVPAVLEEQSSVLFYSKIIYIHFIFEAAQCCILRTFMLLFLQSFLCCVYIENNVYSEFCI